MASNTRSVEGGDQAISVPGHGLIQPGEQADVPDSEDVQALVDSGALKVSKTQAGPSDSASSKEPR